MKGDRLRGQAWVVFTDVAAATEALRSMQDFPFHDKPLHLSFAKTKSLAVARLEVGNKKAKKEKKKPAEGGGAAAPGGEAVLDGREPTVPPVPREAKDAGEPNATLFIENLPEATTPEMLSMLFSQYTGFVDARMVPARPGIAFVEFQNEAQSGVARTGLDGFRVMPECAIKVTFAKH